MASVPCIDLQQNSASRDIGRACRDNGFFYVVGHGVSPALQTQLEAAARRFFARPLAEKMEIEMAKGGKAWRGFFPVGGELTSGKPDLKEGLYFGAELPADHPWPLHGANLFPRQVPELRAVVLDYVTQLTQLGHRLMRLIAQSLDLPADYFDASMADPLVLFRIFNYPPSASAEEWGVGEHTDYGILTILKQDDCGGLEVKSRQGWIAAPPIPDSFVCNIGDMLDRLTGGLYRSTPHRVRNVAGRDRLSYPFFFDPGFASEVKPLPIPETTKPRDDKDERWDKASVHAFQGTYGEYLMGKVGKVFPGLQQQVITKKT